MRLRHAIDEGLVLIVHLMEIASIAKENEVDSIHDLRAVCPNCNAIGRFGFPPCLPDL